jgi:hypothetical protein
MSFSIKNLFFRIYSKFFFTKFIKIILLPQREVICNNCFFVSNRFFNLDHCVFCSQTNRSNDAGKNESFTVIVVCIMILLINWSIKKFIASLVGIYLRDIIFVIFESIAFSCIFVITHDELMKPNNSFQIKLSSLSIIHILLALIFEGTNNTNTLKAFVISFLYNFINFYFKT